MPQINYRPAPPRGSGLAAPVSRLAIALLCGCLAVGCSKGQQPPTPAAADPAASSAGAPTVGPQGGASASATLPGQVGWVNDFDSVFTFAETRALEWRLADYEASTTREVVLVTVASIGPYADFHAFATDLANEWGVGKEGVNNGLVVALSAGRREVRLVTGYGTEKVLTDSTCTVVVNEVMVPRFRSGRYYEGVTAGLDALLAVWN